MDNAGFENFELIGGGVLTAGLGFSGTLSNLFLTSTVVEYSTLNTNETCFDPNDLIASLLPANLISSQGEPIFAERKFFFHFNFNLVRSKLLKFNTSRNWIIIERHVFN
jgi:hypothetical protein